MITILHTSDEGTLLRGTSRGDGAAEILKELGWRWSSRIENWYLPRSQHRAPKRAIIAETERRLHNAAIDRVESTVDPTPRPAVEAEENRRARSVHQAATLRTKAAKNEKDADAAAQVAATIAKGIPLGQPILVGHHSERRHRRDLAKIAREDDRERKAHSAAKELGRRAAAISAREAARTNPQAVSRRIATLETQHRKLTRSINGYRNHLGDVFPPASGDRLIQLQDDLAHVDEETAYWKQVHREQLEAGEAVKLDQSRVSPGDFVQYKGDWHLVIRANAKSVSIRHDPAATWTDTIPYHQLSGHRPHRE